MEPRDYGTVVLFEAVSPFFWRRYEYSGLGSCKSDHALTTCYIAQHTVIVLATYRQSEPSVDGFENAFIASNGTTRFNVGLAVQSRATVRLDSYLVE